MQNTKNWGVLKIVEFERGEESWNGMKIIKIGGDE